MNVFGWSWKWKLLFIGIGIASGGIAVSAFADDGSAACSSDGAPGVVEPQYDQYGRLEGIDDLAGRQHARVSFRGDALDDITLTRFIKNREKPDRWGQTEVWGPTRWSEYNLKTGKLMVVHVYEKGRQLTFTIPADAELASRKFTGAPESCDVFYETCKTLPARTIELTEPLAAAGGCLDFGGMSFALRRPLHSQPQQDAKIDDQSRPNTKVIELPATPDGNGAKARRVCLDGDKNMCVTVYDDEDSNASSPVPAQ